MWGESENIRLKSLLKENVEELAIQKQKEVETHGTLAQYRIDHASLHGNNKYFVQREEELIIQLKEIKQHYNDLRAAHIVLIREEKNEDMVKKGLETELRLYSRDLEVLMNE